MRLREKLYYYQGIPGTKLARGTGNCNTVILGQNKLLLIDPGESLLKCINSLKDRMLQDTLNMKTISQMLFTHVHFDHANAAGMIQELSLCKIRTHPYDVAAMETPQIEYDRIMTPIIKSGEFPRVPLAWAQFFTDLFIGKRLSAKIDSVVHHHEKINHDGLIIEVLFTPGHAPGHIVYYIPEYKTLIGGDLIDREMDSVIESGGCINNMESSWEDILFSLDIVSKLDIELYIPGHGPPIEGKENVEEFLSRNIRITTTKPQKILSLLNPMGSRLKNIFSQLYPVLPFAHHQVKKIEILLLLQYLQKIEKVIAVQTEKGTFWKPKIEAEKYN